MFRVGASSPNLRAQKPIPVGLSSANPRAAAAAKTGPSLDHHPPPSSRPRALSSIRTYLGRRSMRPPRHMLRTPLARAVVHRPERAGSTPRDRFPVRRGLGGRRGCTRRTPTTRRKPKQCTVISLRLLLLSRVIASSITGHRSSTRLSSSTARARPPHLTVVLVQPGVHGVHDVRTNRGRKPARRSSRRCRLDSDHGKRGRQRRSARRGKADSATRRDETGLSGGVWVFPQYTGFGFTVYDNLGVYGMYTDFNVRTLCITMRFVSSRSTIRMHAHDVVRSSLSVPDW